MAFILKPAPRGGLAQPTRAAGSSPCTCTCTHMHTDTHAAHRHTHTHGYASRRPCTPPAHPEGRLTLWLSSRSQATCRAVLPPSSGTDVHLL